MKRFDVNSAQQYLAEKGFGRSQGHIRRMIQNETIRVEREFTAVRIPKKELDKYIRECGKRLRRETSKAGYLK